MSETMEIAVYQGKYSKSVNEVCAWIEASNEYVRITEPLTIEFKALPHDEVVIARVAAIDAEITKVRAEKTAAIDLLEEQKQRLLAITHQEEELNLQDWQRQMDSDEEYIESVTGG